MVFERLEDVWSRVIREIRVRRVGFFQKGSNSSDYFGRVFNVIFNLFGLDSRVENCCNVIEIVLGYQIVVLIKNLDSYFDS